MGPIVSGGVSGVFSQGVNVLQQAGARANSAAQDIARSGTTASIENTADLAESLIALKQSEQEAQAGAALISTADEVLGSVLDIRV